MSTIDLPSALALGARVEPFVLMAKSARGAAAAKLAVDATAAPGVFVFGELIDALAAAQLAGTPHGALLDLFAYGTYRDYTADPSAFPDLNAAQITKRMVRLAIVVQDTCYDVRHAFLSRMCVFGGLRKLPPRFNVIPFLTVHDPELDIKNMV